MVAFEPETILKLVTAARYFVLIGEDRRCRMLLLLTDGPKTPDELVGDSPRSDAQRDIRRLKEAGLVEIDRSTELGISQVWRLTRAGRRAATTLAEIGRSRGTSLLRLSPNHRMAQISPS
jgi:hypothetical protein